MFLLTVDDGAAGNRRTCLGGVASQTDFTMGITRGMLSMLSRSFFVAVATMYFLATAHADHLTWGSSGGSSGGSARGWLVHHGSQGSAGALRVRYYGGTWGMSGSRGSSGGSASSGGSFTRARVLNHGSSGGRVDYYEGPIRRFLNRLHEPIHSHGSSGGGMYRSYGGSSGGTMIPSSEEVEQSNLSEEPGSDESASVESTPGLESDEYEVTVEAAPVDPSKVDSSSEDAKTVEPPRLESGVATLRLAVPRNAAVLINDQVTKSTGAVRYFKSINLNEDEIYTYRVKVLYSVNGSEKTEHAMIKMRAGTEHRLDLRPSQTSDLSSEKPKSKNDVNFVNTVVRVHVPEGAQVLLAGKSTQSVGMVRTFKTLSLRQGEIWNDYAIRVQVDIDGERLTEDRNISIIGGTEVDYHFDFGNPKFASR